MYNCEKKFILFTILLGFVTAQDDIQLIEEFIQEVMQVDEIPGLSIAVVKDGEPYLVNGFGVKNIETGEPVDENTLFYIASTTKAMTGTFLAKVLDENERYDLDTPVKEILEDFYLSEYYRTVNVNGRDLMAHTVSIPSSDFHVIFGEVTDTEELVRRFQYWEATTQFRSEYWYSNVMTTVAGEAAAKLLNMTYEEAMFTEFFNELEMYNTSFLPLLTEEQLDQLASPHHTNFITGITTGVVDMEAYSGAAVTSPAGCVVSPPTDLVKWLQLQTNNGDGPLGPFIRPEVLEVTRQPQAVIYKGLNIQDFQPTAPVTYITDTYGLGWELGVYRDYRMQQHLGANYGWWAKAMVLPDMKAGVFLCANGPEGTRAGSAMNKISLFTLDVLLGEEPWVNSTYPFINEKSGDFLIEENFRQEALIAANIKIVTNSEKELVDYAGIYGNFAMGNISVTYDNETDDLVAYFGTTGTFNLVLANDEDSVVHVFLADAQDPFWFLPPVTVRFYLDEETGEVTSLSVPVMLPQDPPVFIRDLDLGDAPDPPTDGCPA